MTDIATQQWWASARVSHSEPLAHLLRGDVALCGAAVRSGWRLRDSEAECRRCRAVADGSHVTQAEMVDGAGITYRQLDHWVRAGYLRCAVAAAGSGTQRLFLREEIAVAATMAHLVAAGLTVWAAELAARGEALPGGVRVVTRDETVGAR